MADQIKVHMFILMVNDLNKAIEFYKKLDLPLQFYIPEKWAEFMINDIKLGLAQTDQELPERRTGIVFEVEDLPTFYQEKKKEGMHFISEPVEQPHGIMVSFKDPGNNIIDIYQPTPEKLKEVIKEATEKKADIK